MIEETYCSFEQAKSLKELGFPQDCNPSGWKYRENGKMIQPVYTGEWGALQCPTISLAQKWLREEKDIEVIIRKYHTIPAVNLSYWWNEIWNKNTLITYNIHYDTYEQALSAGIDRCIELLKETKE